MRQRFISFRWLPASWGLKGDAYLTAEAYYLYAGEELDRRLAEIVFRDRPADLVKENVSLDYRYGHIDAFKFDNRMAELDITDPDALRLRRIDIATEHAKITPYEAAKQKASLRFPDGIDRDVALLEIEYQFNRIAKPDLEKRRATLRNEPWVAIVNSGFNPEQGIDGVFFEFDWNAKWIEYLNLNGYVGRTPEQTVDDWFTDVCRSHTPAETTGTLLPSPSLYRD